MRELGELTDVERRMVRAVVDGAQLDLAGEPIRGEVIRRILTGGFDGVRPDPRGIRLSGARLVGGLDLAEVESRLPLYLTDCRTTETVRLTGSRLSTVDLSGLVGTNVVAFDARIERGLLLQNARLTCTSAEGTVSVGGARIGGVLDAAGSHLVSKHPDGPAFHANNLRTDGGMFLNNGFHAEGGGARGAVRLSGAVIGGQLNLAGARIDNPNGPALVGDYLSTRSNMMLNHGFHASGRYGTGTIRLVGATVGGRLMFEDGHIAAAADDLALNLARTHVGGDVLLPVTCTAGRFVLNGLVYDGIIREATLDELLDLLANRTTHYTSQPYHQLAAAHQAAGHERDVRRIHVARQRDLLRRGDLDARGRLWHRITGLTVGYGYRPAIALRWWAGALALSVLLIAGVAGPAGLARTTAAHPVSCSLVAQVGLALNTATPLVKPDAQQNCQIDAAAGFGPAVIVATWVLQALGWAFVTLFIAGFTGLVRKSP